MDKLKKFENLLRNIPVSINNFYGDPTIQWEDTLNKLNDLVVTKHLGPVGIITKGRLSRDMCKVLSGYRKKGLKLVILVSISELGNMEKVGHEHRYENIRFLNEVGVPAIAYVRPLTPPYNTSEKIIKKIFKALNEVGCKACVVAGFRGDDNLVNEMQPKEVVEWTLRVKQMSPDIWVRVLKHSKLQNIQLFTRTSCAVNFLLGDKKTYNPYYNSPNLVKCEEANCPLRKTCRGLSAPKKNSLEFIKFLGYDVEFKKGKKTLCHVSPDNRLKCKSCCTTCYMLNNDRIEVKGNIRLGDLTFIRFVTGMIAVQPGRNDNGDLDVGHITFPKFLEVKDIQCLNSWWPIARIGSKCFDCKYCIEKYYCNSRKEFGFSPARLIEKLKYEKKVSKQNRLSNGLSILCRNESCLSLQTMGK